MKIYSFSPPPPHPTVHPHKATVLLHFTLYSWKAKRLATQPQGPEDGHARYDEVLVDVCQGGSSSR